MGDLMEVIPPPGPILVPSDLRALVPGPAFQMRSNCGLEGAVQHRWLQDYGSTERWHYHHNLYRVFDPARFGATRPQYFPLRGGKRFIPDPAAYWDWQPDFSSGASVTRAVEYAGELFRAEPWARSMSLTVNDGFGYSENDVLRAQRRQDGALSMSPVLPSWPPWPARSRNNIPARRWRSSYLWVQEPPANTLARQHHGFPLQ